ncbi:MAG: TlyA family RNA methyltransferase [Myxococcota bacterium]
MARSVSPKAGHDTLRIDVLLADRGLSESRERARALILAGRVFADGRRIDKPGTRVPLDASLEVRGGLPYVGRGGVKLAGALEAFGLEVRDAVALDAGASTGGFCDCLLQRGARRVFAVDVGYGQLDWKIRSDPRVVVMERRNVRHLRPEDLPETPTLITLDLSFISLKTALPAMPALLAPGGRIVALVKPQFEVGKGRVGKGGVVRDEALWQSAVDGVIARAASLSLHHRATAPSPIHGEAGNREFFVLLERPEKDG